MSNYTKNAIKFAFNNKLSDMQDSIQDSISSKIADALEKEQAAINAQLADPETYKDADKIKRLQARLNELDELLLGAISRWEDLESKTK